MKLFHFSEEPDIQIFEPRTIYDQTDAKVWTIDEYHAPHYYFPRECPRVCLWPKDDTRDMDVERFFGMSKANRIIAIETGWYERVKQGTIYRYAFDSADFELEEENAGYYVSRHPVIPMEVERIDDLIAAILNEGIELRITPSLQPLREQILKSTVNFSMIRMKNAKLE
ncbi:DUF6886 family protein [Paenibacillus sp. XY044]|uniref:DUF6886 family protein n=1 Tax=Paenibacillus sp. XY044 TaxID=2026089 RepID=UPI000B98FC5A|nr:DUF6886 family protein [Paenibacillus sp. XY044]OZB96183.1 hypothetical protein CJP46_09740 [Paenibacillus sp. XY044]